MRKTPQALSLPILLAGALILGGCPPDGKMPRLPDQETNVDIVGTPDPGPELSLDVEILIDATTSMSGYATVGESAFNRFVEELEAAIRSGSRQSKLTFFKFGSSIKPIERETAILRKPASFFAEKGVFEQTKLEDAIETTDPKKDRVILTDLFQNEGDINKVVAAFKEKCFDKNRDVGVLMVRSEFDGMVYDAKVPPYRYISKPGQPETLRAFYAIFVGDASRFLRIYQALKSTRIASALDDRAFLVLSRAAVRGYKVQFEIPKSKGKKIRITKSTDSNPFENSTNIHLLSGASEEELVARITVDPNSFGPRLNLGKLYLSSKTATLKGKAKPSDPPEIRDTDEVQPKALTVKDNVLTATLAIGVPNDQKRKTGKTLYKVLFALPSDLEAFSPPPPFVDQSSENPRPGADPQKTINLEKFTRDLIRGWATAQTRYVAKAYIRTERK